MARLRAHHARRGPRRLPAGVRRGSRAGLSPRQGRRDRGRLDADFLAWGPGRLKDARAFAVAARGRRRRAAGASDDEPAVRDRVHADAHRRRGRPPAAPCRPGTSPDRQRIAAALGPASRRCPCSSRRTARRAHVPGSTRWPRPARRIAAQAWSSPATPSRGSPRAGPPDQPRAGQRRQDRRVPAPGRCGPGRSGRLAPRAGRATSTAGAVETLSSWAATRPTTPRPTSTSPSWLGDKNVKLRIHLGLYDDETAQLCHWHIPEAHCLESWSDLRAFDGTATIQQPLIAPLYGGKSAARAAGAAPGRARPVGPGDRPRLLAAAELAPATSSRPGGGPRNRRDRRHALEPEAGHAAGQACRPTSELVAGPARHWSSSSGPTRRSGTAGSPTTAGSRNCPSR